MREEARRIAANIAKLPELQASCKSSNSKAASSWIKTGGLCLVA
jgi:hypothetical protein